jgi:cAMP-dependent protein kinase regulator
MALLARAPRAGSVVATRPSIVLEVKRDALDALAERQPDVGLELAAHCKTRMVQNLVRMSHVLVAVPEADRPALVRRFQTRIFEKNERLLKQDEHPPGLFLVASGEVAVVRRDGEAGDPLVLSQLGPGDVVGEVSMVLRRRADADVIASCPTVTLFLPAKDFLGMIHDHPAVLVALYGIAVERAEETTTILESEARDAEDFVLV